MSLLSCKVSKKWIQVILFFMILSSPLSYAIAETSFSDIENSFAKQAVEELAVKKVIQGMGNGQFHPTGAITRQDFAIILAKTLAIKTHHLPSHPTFTDLPRDHYAFASVEALVRAGIVAGVGSDQFGTGQALTREQMVTIFVRALGLEPAGRESHLPFNDAEKIAEWAKDAVGAAVECGLIQGAEENLFHPQANARREEVVLVTVRFMEVLDAVALEEIRQHFRENYLFEVPEQMLTQNPTPESIVQAVAEGFSDPWTAYMNPQEYQSYLENADQRYVGIGVGMFPDVEGMRVLEVYPDSPAERAGIEAGDVVLKVDDWMLLELPEEERVIPFLGEPGTKASVVVKRKGWEIPFEISREEVYQSTVRGSILDGRVMYLAIERFTEDTGKDFYDTLSGLQDQVDPAVVTGLVIDVRNNPGGVIDSALQILSGFIPREGITSVLRYRKGEEEIFWSANSYNEDYPVPVVLLTNQETASAAEIIVSTMKEYEKATIIGDITFGKGVGQNNVDLTNGGLLRYTSFQILTPNGVSYDQEGIAPHFSLAFIGENQWLDAVRILLSGNPFQTPKPGDIQVIVGQKTYPISSEFIQDSELGELLKEVMNHASKTHRMTLSTPEGAQNLAPKQLQAVLAVYQAEMSRLEKDRMEASARVELIETESIRNVLLERLEAIEGAPERIHGWEN